MNGEKKVDTMHVDQSFQKLDREGKERDGGIGGGVG